MRILCVIPARIGSTRLPEKPLALLKGRPLIQHVFRAASSFGVFSSVVVATDDRRVRDAVVAIKGRAVITGPARNGTERVSLVAQHPEFATYDHIVNLQGDEPFISLTLVEGVINRMAKGDTIATAATPATSLDLASRDVVKVWVNKRGRAVRFSREPTTNDHWCGKHIGIYGYRRDALLAWVRAPETADERAQSLEQLRPLGNGTAIGVFRSGTSNWGGIDTVDDLRRAQTFSLEPSARVSA